MGNCEGRDVKSYTKIRNVETPLDTRLNALCEKALKPWEKCLLRLPKRVLDGDMKLLCIMAQDAFNHYKRPRVMHQEVLAAPDPSASFFATVDAKGRVGAVVVEPPGMGKVPVEIFGGAPPVSKRHMVLVPRCDEALPHHLTKETLAYGITLAVRCGRLDFRLLFDSLAACPLVNQFHYDGFFLNGSGLRGAVFPIENVSRALVGGDVTKGRGCVELLQDNAWITRGFVVSAGPTVGDPNPLALVDISQLASAVMDVVRPLQEKNVPHTVMITKPPEPRLPKTVNVLAAWNQEVEGLQLSITPEVYVLPRVVGDQDAPLGCELVGMLLARDKEAYASMKQDEVAASFLSGVTCDEEIFDNMLLRAAWHTA